MDFQLKVNSQYAGCADFVQLIYRSAVSGSFSYGTGGLIDLDTQFPYHGAPGYSVLANVPFQIELFDGPLISDVSPIAEISDQFWDYLVFRPGSRSASTNIYVTLGITEWSWYGLTTYSSGAWSQATGAVSPPTDPFTSSTFPSWTAVFNP
jgi:hypothetical protein